MLTTLGFSGAFAQPADVPRSPEAARQRLEMRKGELDAVENRAKFIQGDVVEIKKEREKLNAKILEIANTIQKSEGLLTGMEGKIVEMETQEKAIRSDLDRNHDRIAKLLAALQRMGRNPPPVLYTQRTDALQMVRSAMLLASSFPELRNDALALAGKLNSLILVTTEMKAERDRLKTESARLNDSRLQLSSLMETRRQTLAERQSDLEKVKTAAAEISKNVEELSELIGKLDRAVASQTGLGAYEAKTRGSEATDKTAPPAQLSPPPDEPQAPLVIPKAPPASPANQAVAVLPPPAPKPPAADKPREVAVLTTPAKPQIKPSVVELAPAVATFGGASAARIQPAIPFLQAKARLPMPAQGRRVLAFGDKTQLGGQSKGIVLETRHSAQITSPCDGWIVYAGEFRTYGQLLIINAGGGYHVLLAGLSHIDVQPGQFVLAAEPVGTMTGASANSQGKAQSNAPVLYVEFRKDGRPIDPDPWWVEGHQKVQG